MFEPFTPTFFRRLQQLKIHTRRAFLGSRQGAHLSLRRGHGLEFSDYRHYAAGDDFRHIDWSVYARTDRVYVREFREERDLNVMFLLDTSNSMRYPEGEGKFSLARDLALALAYVALADGDTVTFAFLGQALSPRFIGPRAINRVWKEVRRVEPEGNYSLIDEVRAAVARHRIPGKCFLISDFLVDLEEQFRALDFLRSKNYEVALLQILGPSELALDPQLGSSLFVDSETGEILEMKLDKSLRFDYAKALATHVEDLEQYCRSGGLQHVLISSAESVSDVVLTRLPELGLLR